uniref:Uncharacterized protein n=1 Tax=Rhizophora mucronata TaxID=61149 RepID=A0A2P2MJF2_RHIMU
MQAFFLSCCGLERRLKASSLGKCYINCWLSFLSIFSGNLGCLSCGRGDQRRTLSEEFWEVYHAVSYVQYSF